MKTYKKIVQFMAIFLLFIAGMVITDLVLPHLSVSNHQSLAAMPIMIFFALDLTKLADRTTLSRSGGGYTSFRFAPKEYFDVIPLPDVDNLALISNDYVFKAGKDWIYIYTDDYEFDFKETPVDARNSEGYAVELSGFCPGENSYLRQFINEGISSLDGYALLANCKEVKTLAIGKGSCCPASLKFTFESGKKSSDQKGWKFTLKADQEGVSCHYEGVGAMNQVYTLAADDATPDVSQGTATYRIPANTAPTEITDLDNAVQGSLITLEWTSATNPSTITSGATFQLAGTLTPELGTILVLQATTTSTFAERYRYEPA